MDLDKEFPGCYSSNIRGISSFMSRSAAHGLQPEEIALDPAVGDASAVNRAAAG
jgi:hypothetical protein